MDKSEIIDIFKMEDATEVLREANRVKEGAFGKKIILRAIIEFSNFCRGHCQYCGIQAGNKKLERYRFSPEHIKAYAKEAYEAGYRSIILQSGEDSHYDADKISDIIEKIKQIGDILVTLSVGERRREEYAQWKQSGADRYLLKHETADEGLYNSLHSHSTFRKRLECLKMLKDTGYQTGSGFMIGLPGQSLASVADDLLLLKKLEVDMAGIGIYIPHPATAICNSIDRLPDTAELAVRAVAIARLLMPNVHLPSTTSLEVGSDTRYSALDAGANVIMKKVEPHRYRKLYEIYPNPQLGDKSVREERDDLVRLIEEKGMLVETNVC